MSNFIEMTFEDWEKTYKPIKNHIDTNASFQSEGNDGIMFETYGDEIEFVKQQNPNCIWTYITGDNNTSWLVSGWHFVNRLGYFITEVPCPEDTEISVCLQEDNYLCPSCEEEFYKDDADIDFLYEYWGELEKCPKCGTVEDFKEIEELSSETVN